MADDLKKKKHLENVGKHLEKGNLDRAIKELGKLLELDPDDVKARLKLGDLCSKKGSRSEATEAYLLAAKAYEKQGRSLEASTVYKQILRLDNTSIETHVTLAALCQKIGLSADAVSHYHIAAQLFEAKGDSARAVEILRTIAQVDPGDVMARKKISEMAMRDGGSENPVEELRRLAIDFRRKGRREDLAKTLEKLAHIEPQNVEVIRELAKLYLAAGDAKKALVRVQVCFSSDPSDLETLELLAEIFHTMGRPEKAQSVTQEIRRLRAG